MITRKINKTIVAVLAICTAFLISSMYFIPSNAETTGALVVWGEAENPNSYDRTSEDASQWARPTKDGYYFAGWYATTESTEAIADLAEITSAYPKFVHKDALSVCCQVALKNLQGVYTSSQENGSTGFGQVDVRIMTSVDTLQYQKVSFLLGTNQSKEISVDTVYKTVIGSNVNADVVEYDATDVCSAYGEGEGYLVAGYIKNLKSYVRSDGKDSYESDIVITPTWTTMDGTIVKGETAKKQVIMDERVAGCEATLTYMDGEEKETVWYYKLSDAAKAVASQTVDVTIDVRKDNAKLPSHTAYTKTANTTYTFNGNGHTIDASQGGGTLFLINGSSENYRNLIVKDAIINHTVSDTSKFLYVTRNNIVVTLEDLEINSTSNNTTEGLFYVVTNGLKRTINMKNVDIEWNPTNKVEEGLFHFYQAKQIINIVATNTSISVNSNVPYVIYITGADGSTLNLTTNDATSKAALYGSTGEKIGVSSSKSTINLTDNSAQ